jgi:Predicted transcriptional regulator
MSTVTARLDTDTQAQLEKLAAATSRSRSWLVAEAVRQYVAEQSWQVEAIQEGVRQADEGKFVSDQEVTEAFTRWGVHDVLEYAASQTARASRSAKNPSCSFVITYYPHGHSNSGWYRYLQRFHHRQQTLIAVHIVILHTCGTYFIKQFFCAGYFRLLYRAQFKTVH